MPLYEYECEDCGHRFERIQKFSDELVSICPSCGGKVRKLVSSPAIQFKGTGWYITDYARKPSADQEASGSEASSDKDGAKKTSGSKDAKESGSGSSSGSDSESTSKSKTGPSSSSSSSSAPSATK